MASGELGGMHAVAVCRDGRLAAGSYRDGEDEILGDSIGLVHFTPQTLHDLRSVTKSIVALVYGIALDRQLVPALGQTYAIYRSPDGEFFARPGMCTHERTCLADGLVRGTIVECPKHNGRFDYKTGRAKGSAHRRSPVLATKVVDSTVVIDLAD